jgi:hypothetical protein
MVRGIMGYGERVTTLIQDTRPKRVTPEPSERKHGSVASSAWLIFLLPGNGGDIFSTTSVDFERTTRRYISDDGTVHNHRCETLKSYKIFHIRSCNIKHKENLLTAWNRDLLKSPIDRF